MNVANQYSLVHFKKKLLDEQKVLFMLYISHLHFRQIYLYLFDLHDCGIRLQIEPGLASCRVFI